MYQNTCFVNKVVHNPVMIFFDFSQPLPPIASKRVCVFVFCVDFSWATVPRIRIFWVGWDTKVVLPQFGPTIYSVPLFTSGPAYSMSCGTGLRRRLTKNSFFVFGAGLLRRDVWSQTCRLSCHCQQ